MLVGNLHLMEHQPGVADAYVLQFSKMVRENPAIFPGGVDMYKPHLHRVDTYRLVGEAHPGGGRVLLCYSKRNYSI